MYQLNWWKGKPSGSIACTRKQQPRFYWSCSCLSHGMQWSQVSHLLWAPYTFMDTPQTQCFLHNHTAYLERLVGGGVTFVLSELDDDDDVFASPPTSFLLSSFFSLWKYICDSDWNPHLQAYRRHNINWRDVQRKNVVNNVDGTITMSSKNMT